MIRKLTLVAFALLSITSVAKADGPLSNDAKANYERVRDFVVQAANDMPEAHYSFRPSPDVRTFGQLIAHIADAQYLICSSAVDEKDPAPGIEKSKTTKAEIVKALKDGFAYCDKAYSAMNDKVGVRMTSFFGNTYAKLSVLWINTSHTNEHYGSVVTYLRMKGLVPPSSKKEK